MKFSEMHYERIDFNELKSDFEKLGNELENAQSGEEAFQVHKKYYKISDHWKTMREICMIRNDGDMTDEYYENEQKFSDEHEPIFEKLVVEYQKKLYHSRYREYLENKIGSVAFKNIEIASKTVDEKILNLMSEEKRLEARYNKILATAKIDWHGEEKNLSLMTPFLHASERAVRAEAWKKYTDFLASKSEEFDEIYDLLVKNRTEQGKKMGHENYLLLGDARMNRNCYSRADMTEFRKQVKRDFVPFAEKLHEKRRKRLNIDKLSYIDEGVYFTNGNPAPIGTPSQILDRGKKMYSELSPETKEFMDFMCENELFDVEGRKTKKTGGYMTDIPDYQSPFIFANFNGTNGDVDVITHECGHAFQGYLAEKDPIREHADITMETAETHSMSMEFFTEPWMELFFGDRANDYKEMHFEDACIFIPYGTMVDEFQEICYADPGLSPKARKQVWRDLEKQYKPHLDYEGNEYLEKGGFWQKQHHIYDCPLYYIDYCIAGTDALQYKIWMDRNYDEAWHSYLKLCKLSASDFYTGLIKKVGLRSPFDDGCLRDVVKVLESKL
ncbi:oligoendopeptidase, M3 family [Lachnospiraceae bacterium KH1T2]|nr:oligoendopeptidase, M3 family [Lachnospiraceae bacterium KH1T2]